MRYQGTTRTTRTLCPKQAAANPRAPQGRRCQRGRGLSRSALRRHEGDDVRTLLLLLQARKDHLRPRDVLLRVHEVLVHVLVGPDDPGALIRLGVAEAVVGAGLAAHDAPERWPLLRPC